MPPVPGRPAGREGERGFGLDQDMGGEVGELVRPDAEWLAGGGDEHDLEPVADRLCAQALERSGSGLEPVGRQDGRHDRGACHVDTGRASRRQVIRERRRRADSITHGSAG